MRVDLIVGPRTQACEARAQLAEAGIICSVRIVGGGVIVDAIPVDRYGYVAFEFVGVVEEEDYGSCAESGGVGDGGEEVVVGFHWRAGCPEIRLIVGGDVEDEHYGGDVWSFGGRGAGAGVEDTVYDSIFGELKLFNTIGVCVEDGDVLSVCFCGETNAF